MKQAILTVAALLALAAATDGHAQAFSRTDATTYEDNLSLWVVGQLRKSTNLDTGLVESESVYHPATALPSETYSFGKLQGKYTYNANGTMATASDANDAPTFDTTVQFGNWKRGTPQTITYPDGYTKTALVDDLGLIRAVTDEAGNKTCYDFDAMGRMSKITYPSDTQPGVCDTSKWEPTTITFDDGYAAAYGMPAGHWRQTTLTGTGRRVLVFDALWRPVVEQHLDIGKGNSTLSEVIRRYDHEGQVVFASYPMNSNGLALYSDTTLVGAVTTYDALGRPTRVEEDSELGKLVTTMSYESGFLTRTTRPGGDYTRVVYQTYDQPSTDRPLTVATPEGAYTDIARDLFGKPLSMTRRTASGSGAVTRTYTYDARQQLCRTTEPETGATLMGYDAAGNLAWSASGLPGTSACEANGTSPAVLARKSTRSYDNRNRLTALTFADDFGNQSWSYTPDGLPSGAWAYHGPDGTIGVYRAYSYNSRRMLGGTGETLQQPGWYTWSHGYGYDRNGFMTAQVYPDASTVNYTVNALGQVTGVTGTSGTYASNVTYHPNGAMAGFTYGNGIVHSLVQNTRGLPERSKDVYGTSTAVLDDSYDYDYNGNVASISDGRPGARGNRTMTYDGLDRLRTATSPMFNGTIAYTYDVADNIQTLVAPANGASMPARDLRYCYSSANRIQFIRSAASNCTTGSATSSFDFDVQGNLQTKNEQGYVFGQNNQLIEVTGKESYRYDAHGRRILAWAPGMPNILSMYTQAGQLVYQSNGREGKYYDYIYLAGSLLATREKLASTGVVTVKFQHTDALGTPVAVTDVARNVVERSEYEPFGRLINRPIHDGPAFTGHVTDAQTGLTYMQQRYYDPIVGMFLSVDPVAVRQTGDNFNRYAYAFNNPYRFTDPDGRDGAQFYTNPQMSMQVAWTPDQVDAAITIGAIAYGGGAAAAGYMELGAAIRGLGSMWGRGSADSRPNGVPKEWEKTPSNKGGGERFRNPENQHDQVRSMPGNPNSSNPAQQKPYVTRQADGKNYDVNGKEVPKTSPEAHIPKDEFNFIPKDQLLQLNKI